MSTIALITLFLGSIQEGKASIMEEIEALDAESAEVLETIRGLLA